jgi:hypothetical protein
LTKYLIAKAVVCLIICLFISTSVVAYYPKDLSIANRTATDQHPANQMRDRSAVICGYVTDNETGVLLDDIQVSLDWEDFEGNTGWDTIFTNSTGFYSFETVPVIFDLHFYSDEYFDEYTTTFSVLDGQTFWLNMSLIPYPEQTTFIQGYLTDNISGAPLQGANLNINWNDDQGHYWSNYTESDSTGYYFLGTIPGENYIYAHHDAYYTYHSNNIVIQNNSLLWFNISMVPYPPTSAIVCGYITDAEVGDPIPDAGIDLNCYNENGYFYNYTYTDDIGFYSVGTIPGTITIHSSHQNYDSSSSQQFLIHENETVWINISLTYHPEENSEVKGFIVDNETHAAVRGAFINYQWKDESGHFYSTSTFTDQKGFYSILAPTGFVQFFITGNGYTNQNTSWMFINEYSNTWLNATLEPELTIAFDKPQSRIYINDESRFPILSNILSRFFPKSVPLIVGPLEIVVNITKSTMGCNRVEFYIDNVYLKTDTEDPYTYQWDEKGLSRHTIQVIAYDNAGPCRVETLVVLKLK